MTGAERLEQLREDLATEVEIFAGTPLGAKLALMLAALDGCRLLTAEEAEVVRKAFDFADVERCDEALALLGASDD